MRSPSRSPPPIRATTLKNVCEEELEKQKEKEEREDARSAKEPSTRGTSSEPTSSREKNTTHIMIAKKKPGNTNRAKAHSSLSSKMDDVLLISTTNETRARLQMLLSDISEDIFLVGGGGDHQGMDPEIGTGSSEGGGQGGGRGGNGKVGRVLSAKGGVARGG